VVCDSPFVEEIHSDRATDFVPNKVCAYTGAEMAEFAVPRTAVVAYDCICIILGRVNRELALSGPKSPELATNRGAADTPNRAESVDRNSTYASMARHRRELRTAFLLPSRRQEPSSILDVQGYGPYNNDVRGHRRSQIQQSSTRSPRSNWGESVGSPFCLQCAAGTDGICNFSESPVQFEPLPVHDIFDHPILQMT
jgi:hypothetical protein